MDAVLEALHDMEPELIEPSYARAFQFIASSSKKRAFVVILTDLVDKESSRELINSLKLLRPRHLPLVVTIGDRDLNTSVSRAPDDIKDVFVQSAAAEIIHQRGYSTYDDLVHGVNQYPPIFQTKTRKRHESRELAFRENMVIVIQPNLMTYDEKMGLQFGETLVVRKNGCESLNAYPREWVTCKG